MSTTGFNRPQKRRNLRRGIAIGLIAAALLMLIADRQRDAMLESGRLSADDSSAKVLGVLSAPIRGVEAGFSSLGERSRAFEENKSLKSENEALRDANREVEDLRMRIGVFEKLLGLETSTEIPSTRIVARSVSETNGPFVHSALINSGANKGVVNGYAVVTKDGLYGHVVRVGSASARVLLLNDLSSHISVMSQRSQARAIMVGNNDRNPKLEHIPPDADWRVGDKIITSGDGGVLPRGVAIGKVVKLEGEALGVSLNNEGKAVDWVFIYPFNPIQTPEENPVPEPVSEEELPSENEAQPAESQEQ